jgi:hypothetical protein
MPKLAHDPQTGEVDWKKSDLTFPENALPWLLRRRYSDAEIALIRQEAKAYARKRLVSGKPARGSDWGVSLDELRFDPPIRLSRDAPISLPHQITTRSEASAVIAMLPTCGIQWCGVVACLETSTNMMKLRLALAAALDRYGFLSEDDIDARGRVRIPVPPRGH